MTTTTLGAWLASINRKDHTVKITKRCGDLTAEDFAHLKEGDEVDVTSDDVYVHGVLRENRVTPNYLALGPITFRNSEGAPGMWLRNADKVTYPAPPKAKRRAGWWESTPLGIAYYFDGDAWYAGRRGGIMYSDDVAPFINNCDLRYIGPGRGDEGVE